MDITYLGHASFKLRGKDATLITDPFNPSIGIPFPRVSADIVTVSHDHEDHNNFQSITGTARRTNPFIIKFPGEYEISGVSVFGISSFHDQKKGQERGSNTIFVIHMDEIRIVHLGDLGELLTDQQIEEIGEVDVLMVPVGGYFTIGSQEVTQVINQLQPSYVLPMHYRTDKHKENIFGKLANLEEFLQEAGYNQQEISTKLSVVKAQLPDEMEVVVLKY